jgi:hypothetical protein
MKYLAKFHAVGLAKHAAISDIRNTIIIISHTETYRLCIPIT